MIDAIRSFECSRKLAGLIAGVAVLSLLAGCGGTTLDEPTPRAASSAGKPAYPVTGFVGKWGIASYREEKDRVRTEAKARELCRQPYIITKGPSDGVMMHVADDEKLYELALKTGPDSKTYIGFDSPPGDAQDREVVSFSESRIIMRYVDPEVHARYGIFVFVRCQN